MKRIVLSTVAVVVANLAAVILNLVYLFLPDIIMGEITGTRAINRGWEFPMMQIMSLYTCIVIFTGALPCSAFSKAGGLTSFMFAEVPPLA